MGQLHGNTTPDNDNTLQDLTMSSLIGPATVAEVYAKAHPTVGWVKERSTFVAFDSERGWQPLDATSITTDIEIWARDLVQMHVSQRNANALAARKQLAEPSVAAAIEDDVVDAKALAEAAFDAGVTTVEATLIGRALTAATKALATQRDLSIEKAYSQARRRIVGPLATNAGPTSENGPTKLTAVEAAIAKSSQGNNARHAAAALRSFARPVVVASNEPHIVFENGVWNLPLGKFEQPTETHPFFEGCVNHTLTDDDFNEASQTAVRCWLAETFPDEGMVDDLQVLFGSIVDGSRTHVQPTVIFSYSPRAEELRKLVGGSIEGSTGKSYVMGAIYGALGTGLGLAKNASDLCAKKGLTNDNAEQFGRAGIVGKLLMVADEAPKNKTINMDLIKALLPADTPLEARHPGQNPFTFRSQVTVWLASNAAPTFADGDNDNAVQRRFIALPHKVRVLEKPVYDALILRRPELAENLYVRCIHPDPSGRLKALRGPLLAFMLLGHTRLMTEHSGQRPRFEWSVDALREIADNVEGTGTISASFKQAVTLAKGSYMTPAEVTIAARAWVALNHPISGNNAIDMRVNGVIKGLTTMALPSPEGDGDHEIGAAKPAKIDGTTRRVYKGLSLTEEGLQAVRDFSPRAEDEKTHEALLNRMARAAREPAKSASELAEEF
jgi:phage/plasmid-associated DNA primase